VIRFSMAAALAITGCGARSDLLDPAGERETEVPAPPPAPPPPPSPPPSPPLPPPECSGAPGPPPAASCGPLKMPLSTRFACGISLTDCAPVDAEGFVTVQVCPRCLVEDSCDGAPFGQHRVFAMSRLGAGHVIGWCDTTSLVELIGSFDAYGYLGRSSAPRVASIGRFPCEPNSQSPVPSASYLGATLPAKYKDAAALAADWDVLIACGTDWDLTNSFVSIVGPFVREYGRGLLAVSDYVCADESKPLEPAFGQMNAIIVDAGFIFEPVNLGNGSGDVDLPCVADYPL
jgi:hypothetical protein